MKKNQEIQIRDPFVFPDDKEKKYYLFGSTDKNIWGKGIGFDVYIGDDLEHWEGPFPVFRPEENFYSEENFWAPEVHEYRGKYYMFATFLRKDNRKRGTGILVADHLRGPFIPHSEQPVTPEDWFSLDGTLYIDEQERPWMVFCHEWVEIGDGEICALPLAPDLKRAAGEPITLFSASEAPWTTPLEHPRYPDRQNFVTDGPFLFQTKKHELFMLWSSFIDGKYAQGIAKSASGKLNGPWLHAEQPLYMNDGGHGMIFKAFDGGLYLALHTPNETPYERPVFIPLVEKNGEIVVKMKQ